MADDPGKSLFTLDFGELLEVRIVGSDGKLCLELG